MGLRGNAGLKHALETAATQNGIHRISANSITGNILVFYDAAKRLPEIVGYLELFVEHPAPARPRPARDGPTPKAQLENLQAGIGGFLRRLFSHGSSGPPALTPAIGQRRVATAGRAPETPPRPWHAVRAEAVARFWRTSSEEGLSAAEAERRAAHYGTNILPTMEPRPALAILAEQFFSLPMLLLAGSAALSLATGGIADAIVIAAVVTLNAGIGFAVEYDADRTILSMLELSEPEAVVIRDGSPQRIAGDEVVPGDVLVLRHGAPVVADARLIAAARLTIDEAALTGESLPAEKRADGIEAARVALAGRSNMVYRGTVVTGGQGLAIVVATGRHTEIGKIQDLLAQTQPRQTPLQKQMRGLGGQITWWVCGASAAVFAIGLLRGLPALEMLRGAVSLAIAAVPEGLPVIAVICLANGMRNLLREKVLARRLAAIEAIGGVEVLCLDKTGTLTWNRMAAVSVYANLRSFDPRGRAFFEGGRPVATASHPELSKLLEICCLASEAPVEIRDGEWVVGGSPTEAALVRMALAAGKDALALRRQFPLRETRHRSESQPYMSTLHDLAKGRTLIAVKGSPAEVLDLCEWHAAEGKVRKLGPRERAEILAANARMASCGLRVLGAACLEVAGRPKEDAHGLVWLGLVGLADPPREGLKEIIAQFRRAGVRPVMLTGDQAATAESVADALGLNGGAAAATVDATEMETLGLAEVDTLVRRVSVFSRVSPSNKLQIVRALQRGGATVAMTGDGVNDAPALKAADAGIALAESGAKVARGVADLLLLDDRVESILPAIREGRAVRENLRKSVHYMAATNASEVLLMFAGIVAGGGPPFNPRQLLWTNLITDIFPELALTVEPADPEIMSRPPRDPAAPVIAPSDYRRLGRESATMTVAALAAYMIGISRYGPGARTSSMAFLTLTSAQLLHGLTARSETRGAPPAPNPAMRHGLLLGFGMLLASQLVRRIAGLLGAAPVGATDALVCAAAALASFVSNEAAKDSVENSSRKDVQHELVQEWI